MFQQNQIFDNTYQIMGEIGKGGLGTVYLAWHLRLQKYVVLKQISFQDEYEMERIRIEVDTLKSLHHPNLPQVYDFLQAGSAVYTVMDYIQGTDLEHYLQAGIRCDAEDLLHWFRQITEVLVYLHGQNPPVIHSDIKPANIIITPENEAVLIDFNVSVSRKTDTVIGLSVDYASPEQISLMQQQTMKLPAGEPLDGRSDIYSLCASFYTLISWRKPSVFYGTVPLKNMETEYPEVFCEIIDKGMAMEREDRFSSAQELRKAISGMWKKTKNYKIYLAVQILLILISAVLLSFGGYHLVHGIRVKNSTEFMDAYNECIQAINEENWPLVTTECMAFLNEYQESRGDAEKEKFGDIFLGIGRAYAAEENFDGALEYYSYAEDCFSVSDKRYSDSILGIAVAALNNQDAESAGSAFERASSKGMEETELSALKRQALNGFLADKEPDLRLQLIENLEISKIPDLNPGLLYVYKAVAYGEKGDVVRAKENANQALNALDESEISEEERQVLRQLTGRK